MVAPVISASSIGDLQVGTLAHIEYMKVSEITTDLQEFVFSSQVLNDVNVKTATGKSFSWKVMVNDNGAAANVGLAYQDNPNNVDTLVDATADWRHIKTDWATVAQANAMNSGPEQIVDEKLMQEKAGMISLVQLMEANWFGPSVTSSDTTTPWGLKTWITRPTSYSSDGFTGGLVSGGPTSLGISPTTYPRWKNWHFQYTYVTDDDFVRRLNKALEFTKFKSPVDGIPKLGGGNKRAFYSNYGLIGPLQELLKASNENLGMDITKYLGGVVINRMPLIRVPYLEADTTSPIYGVNTGDVFIYRLKNFWMRKVHFENYPGTHNMMADFLDSSYQTVLYNRRSMFVGSTSVTDPT